MGRRGSTPGPFLYPVSAPEARKWGKENFDEPEAAKKQGEWKFAMWVRLVDPSWIVEVSDDYQGYMEDNGFTQARMDYYSDYFQKNMAQAFGEEAHGDAYLLVDDDVYPNGDWNTASTWGGKVPTPRPKLMLTYAGWEYPALTRNDKVDNIYRVDPSASIGCASIIWSRGDGESTQEPKGERRVTTPTIA